MFQIVRKRGKKIGEKKIQLQEGLEPPSSGKGLQSILLSQKRNHYTMQTFTSEGVNSILNLKLRLASDYPLPAGNDQIGQKQSYFDAHQSKMGTLRTTVKNTRVLLHKQNKTDLNYIRSCPNRAMSLKMSCTQGIK